MGKRMWKGPLLAWAMMLALAGCSPATPADDGATDVDGGVDLLGEKAATSGLCAVAKEDATASLSCPSGQTIASIDFASYGTPKGSCPSFTVGTCNATNSLKKVKKACLGQASCNVTASNDVFGDPCSGVGKRLKVSYSCSGGGGTSDGMPVFLLAGQSNMVGNVDRPLFDELMSELGSGTASTRQQRLVDRLTYWYKNFEDGYASYGYSAERVALEASELIRLNGAGLVNATLTQPYSKVYCTSVESPTPGPLALQCGNPFGPELALGHYLGTTNYTPTALVKVAVGGTTLYSDWLPPTAASRTGRSVGALYKQLSQRIKSLSSNPASVHPNCATQKCRWAGFIWFQGENDSMGQANAQEYQKNLAALISDVRTETGASQLPVIVVGMGAWPQKDLDYGTTVLAAQKAVVSADSYAKFVQTDDLSGYFHYDPAAQLIIGERVGKALVPMLTGGGGGGGGGTTGGTTGGGSGGTTSGRCAQADEWTSTNLSCPSGQVINNISFASYGSPTGSCPNFTKGTCHASNSTSIVSGRCLNKQSCSVDADNSLFGDPNCPGVTKKLAVVYSCSGDSSGGGSSGGSGGGSGGGGGPILGSHAAGYQGPIAAGGFVPSNYDAGFSMYVAAWSFFKTYPGNNSQTGLYGTWMSAKNVDVYSDIEGGLGWWSNTRFPTTTPKFIMGGVALDFSAIANGPGAGGGDWDDPRGKYGVAQLSPWLLWPPDGLNLKQGASGELFGYGYLPLPLTNAKSVTAGKNVPTGNQCWTLFLNTQNFKGPATFFLPYFFSKPSVTNTSLAGMFLDSRPAAAGGQISMETAHSPAARTTMSDGRTFARVAPILFPSEADGSSVLVHDVYYYDKTALWDDVSKWFAGGSTASGYINAQNYFHREFSGHGTDWAIWEDPVSGGTHREIVWKGFRNEITSDPYTSRIGWNRDLVTQVQVGGKTFNQLPEYLALDKSTNKWNAVRPDQVPDASGLKNYQFNSSGIDREPYTTPTTGAWKSPGPVAGPFYAYPGDGSKITYYWYRFADQPAMLNADMTSAEREVVQKRVEKLHRAWTKDKNYLAPPTLNKPLASLDPALIVQPPSGLEVGYVPIATRQELGN